MNPNTLGIVVGLGSLVFLFSGMPIAFALGVPSVLVILLFMDSTQFDLIAHTMFDGLNDFGLLAIPLFILMGSIIASTKTGSDLYEGMHRWLHRLPGGLAVSNIVSCAIFSALCGSSPATAAAIGTMGIPEMRKRGYPIPWPPAASWPADLGHSHPAQRDDDHLRHRHPDVHR